MRGDSRHTRRRLRQLSGSGSTLALAVGIAGAIGAAAPAQAACVAAGSTLNCTGDLSGGVNETSSTVTTVNIHSLTDDIGVNGFFFRNTTNLDVAFDASLPPFSIVLDPSTAATARNGFHVITDGAISGTIIGDISGPVVPTITNPSGNGLNNYGVLGFDAEAGIDVMHTGEIDATFSEVRRIGTSRADITSGRFAAIRAETDTGNVVVENVGDISLQGATRIATTENTTGGTAGARALQFRNAVSEHHGFLAQGNGDLTFEQAGNITITGGGAEVTARTDDNTAEAQADFAQISGIDVPYFTSVNGVSNPNLPRFDAIVLDVTGQISVTGGDIETVAEARSTGAGQTPGSAIARSMQTLLGPEVTGVNVGRGTGHGGTADVSIQGDVTATGGSGIATATASLGGTGETPGLAVAVARGQDATGVSIGVNSSAGGSGTGTASLVISGDVVVVSGGARAEATGTGTATYGTLYSDSTSVTPSSAVTATPGRAYGVGVTGAALGLVDINGTIDVRSGDSFARLTGSDLRGFASGQPAHGMGLGSDTDFTSSHDMPIIAQGGNARIELDGARVSGFARAGGASGASILSQTTFTHTHTGEITVRGGDAMATAVNGASIQYARGGDVLGIEIVPFGDTSNGTLVNQATIRVTGGDATASGPALDANTEIVGGSATGIYALTFVPGSFANVVHEGLIVAVGGDGDDARGGVNGIMSSDWGSIQIAADGSEFRSGASIVVNGRVEVEGEGQRNQFIFETPSAGVSAQQTGAATITVGNGGVVEAVGARVHGLSAFANQALITVENGAEVSADGSDAHGIFVRSYDYRGGLESRASTNRIVVENGATVSSTQGNAIRDLGVFSFDGRDFQTGLPTTFTDGAANATSVDLAGLVTGGNGIAIDLGDGEDDFINRATGVANGDVLMGTGADTVTTRAGSTLNGTLDMGDGADRATIAGGSVITGDFLAGRGDDRVRIADDHQIAGDILLGPGQDTFLLSALSSSVAADGGAGNDAALYVTGTGEDAIVDLTAYAFTNIETFAQNGPGTLTMLDNGSIFQRYEVRGGTFVMNADNALLDVRVTSGARLMGTGRMGDLSVAGTIAPGNSIGTLQVAGDATFDAGSTFEVEIAADGTSDLLEIGGTASLAGTLSVLGIGYPTGYPDAQTYTVLTAAGGLGGTTFDQVTDNLPDVDVVATHNANDVVIAYERAGDPGEPGDPGDPGDPGPETMSPKEVYPNSLQAGLGAGRLFSDGLRQRGAAGLGSHVLDGRYLVSSHGPTEAGMAGPGLDPYGVAAWARVLGLAQDVDDRNGVSGYDAGTYGLAGGVDGTFGLGSALGRAGLGFGYTRTDADIGAASADIDAWHVGLYGGMAHGPFALSGALSYAWQDYDFSRFIPFIGGGGATATGDTDGNVFAASLEASYDLAARMGIRPDIGFRLAPTVSLDHVHADRDGFTETGAGVLNLTVGDDDISRTWLGAGLAMAARFDTEAGLVLTPNLQVMYEHNVGDRRAVTQSLIVPAAAAFTTPGVLEDDGAVSVGAGLGIGFADRASLDFGYDGSFGANAQSHSGHVELTVRF